MATKYVTLNGYFTLTGFFRRYNVGTPGKHVNSACYDKQQVCVYLQHFS